MQSSPAGTVMVDALVVNMPAGVGLLSGPVVWNARVKVSAEVPGLW